ncbi:MAG: ArsC family transcriptional regulator [Ruminococcus sp.]|nr:ArsC family transcriptional regulator [Ruminococcus sp.]
MNIQIFGTKKSADTRKAERWFKERRIKYQLIDMKEKGMSKGEFTSVKQAVGGLDALIDPAAKDKDTLALLQYTAESGKEEKLFENQQLIRLPIVRNGKKAAIGYCPEIWDTWE